MLLFTAKPPKITREPVLASVLAVVLFIKIPPLVIKLAELEPKAFVESNIIIL